MYLKVPKRFSLLLMSAPCRYTTFWTNFWLLFNTVQNTLCKQAYLLVCISIFVLVRPLVMMMRCIFLSKLFWQHVSMAIYRINWLPSNCLCVNQISCRKKMSGMCALSENICLYVCKSCRQLSSQHLISRVHFLFFYCSRTWVESKVFHSKKLIQTTRCTLIKNGDKP